MGSLRPCSKWRRPYRADLDREPSRADRAEEGLGLYSAQMDGIHLPLLDLNIPGMGEATCSEELTKANPRVKAIVAGRFSPNRELANFWNPEPVPLWANLFKFQKV